MLEKFLEGLELSSGSLKTETMFILNFGSCGTAIKVKASFIYLPIKMSFTLRFYSVFITVTVRVYKVVYWC